MSTESILLSSVASVKRLFGVREAKSAVEQCDLMVRKLEPVLADLRLVEEKSRKSQSFEDASEQNKLEQRIAYFESMIEVLQLIQRCLPQGYTGVVFYNLEDVLWPLALKMTTRNLGSVEQSRELLIDTHRLHKLCVEFYQQRKVARSAENEKVVQPQLKQSDEKRLCHCGELMGQCEKCDAWVKPCFLKMGMIHVCE